MTYQVGDRVQVLGPLHEHPRKGLVAIACIDYEGDRTGKCGLPHLRGTVIHVGVMTGQLIVKLDRNGQAWGAKPEHVRPLDAVERIAELA